MRSQKLDWNAKRVKPFWRCGVCAAEYDVHAHTGCFCFCKRDLLLNTLPSLEIMKLRRRKKTAGEAHASAQAVAEIGCCNLGIRYMCSGYPLTWCLGWWLLWYFVFNILLPLLQNFISSADLRYSHVQIFSSSLFHLGLNERKVVFNSPFQL